MSFAIGYLCGITVGLLIYILLIGSIYYCVKRYLMQRYLTFSQAVSNKWILTSSMGLTILGLVGRAINH